MLKAALRDSLVYGLASLLSKGLAIFLLPLYTRVLSPGDYGAYDLLVTLGALANLVVALEVSQGLARHWADTREPHERRRLASTTFWFTAMMYGVFLTAGEVFAPWLNRWLIGNEHYLTSFRIAIGFIAVNGIFYLLLNQFRWELRSKSYALVSFLFASGTLIFSVIFCLLFDLALSGVILAQLVSAGGATLLSLWLLRGTFGLLFDRGLLKAMLTFSIPLVPAGVAVFVSLYINRFFLGYFGTLDDIGIFGIGNRIAGLISLLVLGVQAALTPLIYQHFKEPETPRQIARLFSWFFALSLSSCLFLGLFAKELLILFASPDYLGAAPLVMLLAPALLLSQMYIFAPGIAIAKKTRWQLWITLGAALVGLAANWLLVPPLGALGAALATLLSSAVFFLAWLMVSQTLYSVPYASYSSLASVLVFILCAFLGRYIDHSESGLWTALLLKLLLFVGLLIAMVVTRLLSFSDIHSLAIRLRRLLMRA
ncbi:O-antigen/teichoic acid export membrane protein [Pseudomonas sp. SLBN-26]|uniref:oligosaccharide flippase family protein n=1 Tax=Pseudomonadaceae TaxID=135621 RepID=UPI00114E6A46|nr:MULTISPECIES: oligosaccharide flippase family protein [Pseudomonas]MCP1621162.1 O-antigen/teichoic acid export membrane protein [Pseudomonas otitidis]TQL10365.1 O-antigen/teichoic acid export membrane protein [Pseudomonas sp. SLBN-26]